MILTTDEVVEKLRTLFGLFVYRSGEHWMVVNKQGNHTQINPEELLLALGCPLD